MSVSLYQLGRVKTTRACPEPKGWTSCPLALLAASPYGVKAAFVVVRAAQYRSQDLAHLDERDVELLGD